MLTVYEVEKKEWLLQIPDRARDIIMAPLHHYTVKTTFALYPSFTKTIWHFFVSKTVWQVTDKCNYFR